MQYEVPQFIEMEIKVVGPLSFRQFIIVGIGGVISFILYAVLASKNFILFLLAALIVMGISFAMAVGQVQGVPLLKTITNFLGFTLSGRTYLWKKRTLSSQAWVMPPMVQKQEQAEQIMETKKRSQLDELSTRLDTNQ